MNEDGARNFAFGALIEADAPAIIYADGTTAPPLLYVQEVWKPTTSKDIKIISSIGKSENSPEFNKKTIDKLVSENNVYVVSKEKGYCPDFLRERYEFEREGVLWLVINKE